MTDPTFSNPDRLASRLASRSASTDPLNPASCQVWLGACDKFGFGRMHTSLGVRSVHRIAYILAAGGIPEGKFVLHSCGNRKCVNFGHLFLEDPPAPK